MDVALFPPNNATNDLTDEDSGDEEAPIIDNVPASQINALATVLPPHYVENPGIANTTSVITETSPLSPISTLEVMVPSTSSTSTPHTKKNKKKSLPQSRKKSVKTTDEHRWKKQPLSVELISWPTMCTVNMERCPLEYFELVFDDDVVNLMVKYTNQYAAKRNRLGDCSESEMKCFVAILLFSGYVDVPRKDMYWEMSLDTHNALVSDAMSRDRFKFIMSNLHVCNNDELDVSDRFAKVRPLIQIINDRCISFTPHKENHSVDESMVPYFGRHGAKQFIRGKPIRYGYKFWCGGPSTGYLSWLEPYQGAGTLPQKYADKGLGYGVVMTYVDRLENFPYTLHFDNFFTSIDLLRDLRERNIQATGTIRSNRLSTCDLKPDDLKKEPRGTYDFRSHNTNSVLITSWNDNSVVSVASNFDSIFPTHQVTRYSQKQKKRVTISQPHVIHRYNKYMGGIDRADQNIALYRISIRGKKWYFPIISQLIDVAEQNAWQLHKENGGKLDHLHFRRRIVTAILESSRRVVHSRGRPSSTSKIDSRYDKIEHYVADLPVDNLAGRKKQLNCRHCKKKCTTECIKCAVPLHVSCFIAYHNK